MDRNTTKAETPKRIPSFGALTGRLFGVYGGIPRPLHAIFIVTVVKFNGGKLSDRWGRKRLMIAA